MTLVILGTIGMISTVGMAEDKNASARTSITFNWFPYPPSDLLQYALNDAIALPFGGTTKANVFMVSGKVSDPDNDMVSLEVEVEPVGTPFTNVPNCQSATIVYSGSFSNVGCYGLTSGKYHWQARAVDIYGAPGNWVSAGGNLESSPDIIINYIPDRLYPGDSLKIGQSITSTNGKFKLTLQADGNLVLSSGSQVMWTAGISGRGGVVAVMQTDGNFIVYSSTGAIWYTNTQGTGAYMVVQNDGNVVIYNQNYQALWETKIIPSIRVTSPNGGEKWKHGQLTL
jgi:hypothetical protein